MVAEIATRPTRPIPEFHSQFTPNAYRFKRSIDTQTKLRYTSSMNGGITRMSFVKTAISIQEPLLREVEALARQMAIPKSRLFVMAVEEFIQQHRNRQLLDQLNQVYTDAPDPAEQVFLSRMKSKHRHLMAEQW